MRWIAFVAVLILASACGRPPIRTHVCLVWAPTQECLCQDPDGKQYELTLEACNKYVAFPPDDAERIAKRLIECQRGGK